MKFPGTTAPHAHQYSSCSAMDGIILQTMSSSAANCMMMIRQSHFSEKRQMTSCWPLHGGHTGKGCSATARKSKSLHAVCLGDAGPAGQGPAHCECVGILGEGVQTTSHGYESRQLCARLSTSARGARRGLGGEIGWQERGQERRILSGT